ncbi:MAG: GlcNAc-PI de-N-acetylase, partial [Phototrophicales bacterium]
MRRILIAFAHPDDESFGLGGLIAKYVDDGAEVYLICTTNGDAGTIPPEMLNGYNSVAELRLSELQCAAQKLGLKEVFTFGYKDSGMMGAETNNDPQASWYVWQNNPDELIQRVVTVIRQINPQVVITFNRYGGYGHPDHIAIQRATEKAFFLAGDPSYMSGDLP